MGALIVALASLLFIGSTDQDFFYVSSIEKEYKNVINKESKQEIKQLFKTYHEQAKIIDKGKKKFSKLYINSLKSKETSIKQFEALEKEQFKILKQNQDNILQTRIKYLQYMSIEEWQVILSKSEKYRNKQIKKANKNLESFDLNMLQNEINNSSLTTEQKQQCLSHVTKLKSSYLDLFNSVVNPVTDDLNIIKGYSSTISDLDKVATNINSKRLVFFNSLMTFHSFASQHFNNKEWDKVSDLLIKVLTK